MGNKLSINLYVFFGPQGSGKTTQALLLREKMGLDYISWGQISREIALNRGPYKEHAKIVRELNVTDKRFPNGFIAKIIEREIEKTLSHSSKGIILDGFPRRIEEAEELLDILRRLPLKIKSLVKFNLSYEILLNRIAKRVYCPTCGKFYNQITKSGKIRKTMYCDDDKTLLIKREDDEMLVEERFVAYLEESLDAYSFLIPYSELSFDVNANQDEVALFAEIVTKLNSQIKKSQHIYRRTGQTQLPTLLWRIYSSGVPKYYNL